MATLKICEKSEARTVRNYRANGEEMKLIQKNADKYCDGDISKWIRYAAMNCVPSKDDLMSSAPRKSS